jgi:hypothetical protein
MLRRDQKLPLLAFFSATVTLVLLLAGCSGRTDSTSPSTISGTVMDGYLKNATVFLDLNDNGVFDSGEPSTTTDSNGIFSIKVSDDLIQAHSLIASADVGITIDLDRPNSPITQQYFLTSPRGKNTVISPITTLIAAKVGAGATLAAAEAAVLSDMGMTGIDPYKDYVAAKASDAVYQQVHNIAAATVELLKAVETEATVSTKLSEKLSSVLSKYSTAITPELSNIKSASNPTSAALISNQKLSVAVAQSNSVNSNVSGVSAAEIKTGQLVDAPVEGVSYVCGNQKGKTAAGGFFKFQQGQACQFAIGKVSIGSVPSVPTDQIVTPYDLVNVSRLSKIDSNVIGIAQFIQSIDSGVAEDRLTVSEQVVQKLDAIGSVDLSNNRESVKVTALQQLVSAAEISLLVSRSQALKRMEDYLNKEKLDRNIRVSNPRAPLPSTSSRFQYTYKYGWRNTDQYGLKIWCNMDGNPPGCTPTYFVDGCNSYNGSCTKTNGFEQIADSSDGKVYRAYPIKPNRTFVAKYLGVGIGGGHPEYVKIYDSKLGSWSSAYTPSAGEMPNKLLVSSNVFDIFYTGERRDASGKTHSRHPGVDDTVPGFQVYLGQDGVQIEANTIYWIVMKYSEIGVRNERCVDFIGPNSFPIADNFDGETKLQWGLTTGNGFAFELMSSDGDVWEPSNMLQGGICNTFLSN